MHTYHTRVLAQDAFMGHELACAERILDDWRKGRLGLFTLEPPPSIPFHTGYYRALGIKKEGSDQGIIKTAYRSKARVLHPDLGGDRFLSVCAPCPSVLCCALGAALRYLVARLFAVLRYLIARLRGLGIRV
jgi:hypothetical protein